MSNKITAALSMDSISAEKAIELPMGYGTLSLCTAEERMSEALDALDGATHMENLYDNLAAQAKFRGDYDEMEEHAETARCHFEKRLEVAGVVHSINVFVAAHGGLPGWVPGDTGFEEA